MRTMLRSKVTLLFMMLGILLAIPAVALADQFQADADTLATGTGSHTQSIDANQRPGTTQTYNFSAAVRNTGASSNDVFAAAGDKVNVTNTFGGAWADAAGSGSGPGSFEITAYDQNHQGVISITVPCDAEVGTPQTMTVGLSASATNGETLADSTKTLSYNITPTGDPHESCTPADTTGPDITITTPPDPSATYTLGQNVLADYACSDPSGVKSCVGPVADEAAIDTASVGSKSFKVDAEDNLGNKSSLTHNYSVIYDFSGFFAPVDNPVTGKMNQLKAGSAIPVKFSLAGNQGLNILNPNPPKVTQIKCPAGADLDQVETTVAASNSGLSFDASTGWYNYTWKTDKSFAGKCYQLDVTLNDDTHHTADFYFTK